VHDARPDLARPADILAASLAAQGRFAEAVELAQGALELARQTGQRALATEIDQRLGLYRRQRAFQQSPAPADRDSRPG
jgi:hypothetical protein